MMTNTETKKVKIIPKQPRFISDILQLPARIDEEMKLELNVREIVRCMQFGNVFDEEGNLLTPENFAEQSKEGDSSEEEGTDEEEGGEEQIPPTEPSEDEEENVQEPPVVEDTENEDIQA